MKNTADRPMHDIWRPARGGRRNTQISSCKRSVRTSWPVRHSDRKTNVRDPEFGYYYNRLYYNDYAA